MGEFLTSARSDPLLKPSEENIRFLRHAPTDTPYIERMEFRTRTDEFALSRQRYALRVVPKGWGERAADAKIREIMLKLNKAEYELALDQVLRDRYGLVIDLLQKQRLLSLKRELLTVCEDRGRVLRKQMDATGGDVGDLIKAESRHTGLKLEIIDLENAVAVLKERVKNALDSDEPVRFDPDDLMAAGAVQEQIRLGDTGEIDNVWLKRSRLLTEFARSQYQLEFSESRKYIRYVEASYESSERDDFEKAFSLEMGIQLPFVRNGQTDIVRRRLDVLTEQGRHRDLETVFLKSAKALSHDLSKLSAQYNLLTQKAGENDAERLLDAYMQFGDTDPLTLLDLRENILKNDMTRVEVTHEIYRKYVEWLDTLGRLSEKSLDRMKLTDYLDQVRDKQSFLVFVRALLANRDSDIRISCMKKEEWEGDPVEFFLQSALVWADKSGFGETEGTDQESLWKRFAVFLYHGNVCE